MTMSMPPSAFQPDERPLGRVMPVARGKSLGDRCCSLVITLAIQGAVVAALIFGMHVASPKVTEETIRVEIRPQETRLVEARPLPAPQVALPPMLRAPPPLIDIATPPPPAAPAAITPQPETPVMRPAPVVTSAPPAAAGETPDSYYGRLLAHLNRYKRYPAEARMARQEGVAHVRFVMDRLGRISRMEIVRSSGRAALDREALAMLDRAQPLPPMPPGMTEASLDATVPVNFSLRAVR